MHAIRFCGQDEELEGNMSKLILHFIFLRSEWELLCKFLKEINFSEKILFLNYVRNIGNVRNLGLNMTTTKSFHSLHLHSLEKYLYL